MEEGAPWSKLRKTSGVVGRRKSGGEVKEEDPEVVNVGMSGNVGETGGQQRRGEWNGMREVKLRCLADGGEGGWAGKEAVDGF